TICSVFDLTYTASATATIYDLLTNPVVSIGNPLLSGVADSLNTTRYCRPAKMSIIISCIAILLISLCSAERYGRLEPGFEKIFFASVSCWLATARHELSHHFRPSTRVKLVL